MLLLAKLLLAKLLLAKLLLLPRLLPQRGGLHRRYLLSCRSRSQRCLHVDRIKWGVGTQRKSRCHGSIGPLCLRVRAKRLLPRGLAACRGGWRPLSRH